MIPAMTHRNHILTAIAALTLTLGLTAACTGEDADSEPSSRPQTVRYSEGIASSSTVAPGQKVEWEAGGFDDAREGTTCNLTSVDRYAS